MNESLLWTIIDGMGWVGMRRFELSSATQRRRIVRGNEIVFESRRKLQRSSHECTLATSTRGK